MIAPLLKETGGKEGYQNWLMWLCDTFATESGYAGRLFIFPCARERMLPDEFALAQRFSGVMVDSPGTAEGGGAIRGLKGTCGYTIIGTPWLEKPDGAESLKYRLVKIPEISLLPCNNRIIIKSGELAPPLGK